MSVPSVRRGEMAGRSVPVIAVDGRAARAFVATLVIGGYMALGLAFRDRKSVV